MRHMNDFSADSRFEVARDLLDNEHDLEAERAFSELIEDYPDWSGAYGNRGLARMHLGRDGLALEDFCRVIELDPEDAMARSRKAEALRNLGRYKEALEAAVEALGLDPEDPDAHYIRGWLFFLYGQYESAAQDLQAYIDGFEDYGEIEDMLEVCNRLCQTPQPDARECERILRENGFSSDRSYNARFEEDGMFCPYAHCVRMLPGRGPDADDVCAVTGFSCPGGTQQAQGCEFEPFEDEDYP